VTCGEYLSRDLSLFARSPEGFSSLAALKDSRTGLSDTAAVLCMNSLPLCDHVGAAAAILRTMPVRWVADSGQRYGGHAYNDALAALACVASLSSYRRSINVGWMMR
jgi:hypothetical protein